MSGRRRPAGTRAGEGQLSLLAGILTKTDRTVLELARGPGLAARVADQAPRVLGLSPTRFFQLLGRLLDRPEAADAEPELVARLRAVQDQRRQLRRTGSYGPRSTGWPAGTAEVCPSPADRLFEAQQGEQLARCTTATGSPRTSAGRGVPDAEPDQRRSDRELDPA